MGFLSNLFSNKFDDPTMMSNEQLLAAIAGQADWLEKMNKAPFETKISKSILELTKKRKGHIANLCLELLTRNSGEGKENYPGATSSLNAFSEAAEKAKELESTGLNKSNSSVRAVKDILFTENGALYASEWEI